VILTPINLRAPSTRPYDIRSGTSIVGWLDWWPDAFGAQHERVAVLRAYTTPAGEDPKGEITTGTVVIRGRWLDAKLVDRGGDVPYRLGNCVELACLTDREMGVGPGEWFPDLSADVETDAEVLLMRKLAKKGFLNAWAVPGRRKRMCDGLFGIGEERGLPRWCRSMTRQWV
jgi:hypothetical protein